MKFSGLNPKGQYLALEKEKENVCVVLTYLIKRASEIAKVYVAVVQQRLRNVQKSVMHVHVHVLLQKLPLLWSRNFATMVTWRHTSPLYSRVFGTAGSVMTVGLSINRCLRLENQFDDRGQDWLTVQKVELRRLQRLNAIQTSELSFL